MTRWKRKKVTLRINIDYLYWKAQEGKGTKATPMLTPVENPRAQDSQKQFVGTQTMRQEIVCGNKNHGVHQWRDCPMG
jgi:hypothetical protein